MKFPADFPRTRSAALVGLALPLLWLLVDNVPAALRDGIFPFDSALIAANGALFSALFADFGTFLSAPVDWLWGYYDQYPALSVRRHPPLFGFVAGLVYSVIGVSTVSAKLTILLFGVLFTVGTWIVARRLLGDDILASLATLLIVATPQIGIHFHSVWLDIPSLSLAIWAFWFYLRRLDGDRSFRNVLGMVVFSVLALYTYQPTLVLLCGIFLHLLIREWRTCWKDGPLLGGAAVLVVLMLPLVAFTVYFAQDNLQITTGEIPEEWQEFASPTYADWMIRDRLSVAYWAEYGRMILYTGPVQLAGAVLWLLLLFKRRPPPTETLMAVCLVVTYLGFSWLVVKGHRYTLYMLLPASFLAVAALRDAVRLFVARADGRAPAVAALAVLACAVLQGVLARPWAPYTYLSGVGEPIADILASDPEPSILYSGRADAGFVFYARSLDRGRAITLHRASVQLTDPAAVDAYVREHGIDHIVVEIDNPGYDTLEVIDRFRESLVAYADSSGRFEGRADYRLPYGADAVEGHVLLRVYSGKPPR